MELCPIQLFIEYVSGATGEGTINTKQTWYSILNIHGGNAAVHILAVHETVLWEDPDYAPTHHNSHIMTVAT